MTKSFHIFFLALSVFTHYLLAKAVPLTSVFQYDDNDGNDTDDMKVIEVPSNYLENLDDKAPKDIIDLSFYGEALFGEPDVENTAKLVANYTPEQSAVNPEELGSYLEGDILVPLSKETDIGRALTKNGIVTQSSRWPGGVVPFEILDGFGAHDLAMLQQAMEEYHRRTCIRFVPRSTEHDYISITSSSSGCWSSVGRVGGRQEVNLQTPGCMSKVGTPIHELMHALGFLHEQNRSERDEFVNIQYQNIQPHAVSNFEKSSNTQAFGVPYDYGSVMHYSANAFSSNGRATILATQPGGDTQMGQRNGFSPLDVEKLNRMYNCGNNVGGGFPVPQGPGGFFPGPAPVPVPIPVPAPAPLPLPPQGVGGGGLIGSFLGGLINGLG